jgi:hypothetical protein
VPGTTTKRAASIQTNTTAPKSAAASLKRGAPGAAGIRGGGGEVGPRRSSAQEHDRGTGGKDQGGRQHHFPARELPHPSEQKVKDNHDGGCRRRDSKLPAARQGSLEGAPEAADGIVPA